LKKDSLDISLHESSNHPANYYYHRPAHHLTCNQLGWTKMQ